MGFEFKEYEHEVVVYVPNEKGKKELIKKLETAEFKNPYKSETGNKAVDHYFQLNKIKHTPHYFVKVLSDGGEKVILATSSFMRLYKKESNSFGCLSVGVVRLDKGVLGAKTKRQSTEHLKNSVLSGHKFNVDIPSLVGKILD